MFWGFFLDESARPEEVEEFFNAMGGGSRAAIPNQEKGGDDEQFEKDIDAQVELFKVSDSTGGLKIEKVGQKPLSQTALNSNVSIKGFRGRGFRI